MTTIIDRLGKLNLQRKRLEEEEAALKAELAASYSPGTHDGNKFRVTISEYLRTSVDYRGLIESLKVPPRTIRNFTQATTCTRIVVSPR